MSGKQSRQVRKEFNKLRADAMAHKREVADQLAVELLNAPFKYRFRFAMKILFRKRRHKGE